MITALRTAMRTSMPRFVARLVLMLTLVLGTLGTASAQTVTYFHNDIAGTPMLATDAAGAVVWKENYLPYGYRQVADPASGGNKLWFAGKAYDPETQLSYMGARYYMPLLGRFTGIDPVGIVPEQPHSFNRYAYANNNPYKYVDPDGKIAETVWDAFNIALGFQSLVSNLRAGNWSGAAVDGVGLGIDGVAAAIPLMPGGVGAAIAAHRAADAAKVGLAEARTARDALAAELAPLKGKAPATVVGGYNVKTGEAAARACGGGKCAENHVSDALGGVAADIRFTEAVRPRTGAEVPVCQRCEATFGRGPFPSKARFKSDE